MRFFKRPLALVLFAAASPVVFLALLLGFFFAYNRLVAGFVAEYEGISVTIGEERRVTEIAFGQNRPDGRSIEGIALEFENSVRKAVGNMNPDDATAFLRECGRVPETFEGDSVVSVTDGVTHFYFDPALGGALGAVRTIDDEMSVILPQGKLSRGDDWAKVKRMLGEPSSTHKIPAAN